MENSNDYNDAYKAVSVIRDLARETKAHFWLFTIPIRAKRPGPTRLWDQMLYWAQWT